jgi:hypothetical protein
MTKRRRGGGEAGETDIVDAQLLERDAAEDLAFLRSPIPACPLGLAGVRAQVLPPSLVIACLCVTTPSLPPPHVLDPLPARTLATTRRAMDLRDSLLDFEKNRAARTTVIDDQSDYFDSSAHWLTDEQKKQAAAKEKYWPPACIHRTPSRTPRHLAHRCSQHMRERERERRAGGRKEGGGGDFDRCSQRMHPAPHAHAVMHSLSHAHTRAHAHAHTGSFWTV